MMRRTRSYALRRGFTLTEIAIVLGVMGMIMGAVWVAAGGVYQNFHVTQGLNELVQVSEGLRALYENQSVTGDGSQELTTTLISAKVIPADSITSTTTARAPWGSSSFKVFSDTYSTAGDAYQVLFVNIPTDACIQLVMQSTAQGHDPKLVGVGIASPSAGNRVTTMITAFPVSAATAKTKCGTVNIDFAFRMTLR